jgi:hypothetical protein
MIKFLLTALLLTGMVLAQTAPSSYTPHLNLRLYAGNSGTINPGKDSLDANYSQIDAGVKANFDTINAIKADLYTQHNYDGTHKNAVIAWDMLATAAKSVIIQTTGNQSMAGLKTFTGGVGLGNNARFLLGTNAGGSVVQGELYRTGSAGADLLTFFYGTNLKDTIASYRWIRANLPTLTDYVSLSTNQTIGGNKTFDNALGFSVTGRLVLPSGHTGFTKTLFTDNTQVLFKRTTGVIDTLLSRSALRSLNYFNDLLPFSSDVYNIGGASYRWNNIYAKRVIADTFIVRNIQSEDPAGIFISDVAGMTFKDSVYTIGARGNGSQAGAVYSDTVGSPNTLVLQGRNGVKVDAPTITLEADDNVRIAGIFARTWDIIESTTGTITPAHPIIYLEGSVDIIDINPTDLFTPGSLHGETLTLIGNAGVTAKAKHDAGSFGTRLVLAGGADFTFDRYDVLVLIYNKVESCWVEISRSNNN